MIDYPPGGAPQPPAPRRWTALWLPLLLAVAAVVAAAVYVARAPQDSSAAVRPDGTADRFYAAVNAHNRADWSRLLCKPDQAGKLAKFSAVSMMTADRPSVRGSSASASGHFQLTTDVFLQQSTYYAFTATLQRRGSGWCVAHLASSVSKDAPTTAPNPLPSLPGSPTPATPTASTPPTTSSAPSTPPTGTCRLPAGATADPGLTPPGSLTIPLSNQLGRPAFRWHTGALSALCFDNVSQLNLNLFLIVLGVSYEPAGGGRTNQAVLKPALSTTTPKHVVVTVSGTLIPKELTKSQGTGSVEVDWY